MKINGYNTLLFIVYVIGQYEDDLLDRRVVLFDDFLNLHS